MERREDENKGVEERGEVCVGGEGEGGQWRVEGGGGS